MKKITLGIEGMSCAACSSAIEKHLNKQEGILLASVNLVMANATIEYDEQQLTLKQIENFIKEIGYKSTGLYKLEDENKKFKSQKIWFILFGILTIILLYISMGMMIGLPLPNILDMHKNSINYAITLSVLTIPFLIYGFDIFKNGFKTLFHKAPNMDTLVTLGVLSSLGYSIYGIIKIILGNHTYVENLYLESCCVIIYFIKLGRFIDHASKNKTKNAIKDLVQITPNFAIVKDGNQEKHVTIDEVQKGDIVICHAGQKIAVDGIIVSGEAHLDESFITGESKPSLKTIGDRVVAGSINYNGYLAYKAERIGKDSTISEIVHLVVEATNTKMPIAKIADKVSGIFIPVVMAIAFLAFIFYFIFTKDFNQSLQTFVTVLVVACPCSLGLATPLAIVVSEGRCAKQGILVKKSQTLEIANKVNVVIFDKTGTLTYGKLKITKWFNYSSLTNQEILQIAASVENKSSHPIAMAFVDYIKEQSLPLLDIKKFENHSGLGISAKFNRKTIMMGNAKMLKNANIENPYLEQEKQLAAEGNSIVYLVINNKISGLFGVNDLIRENAKQVIQELKQQHIEVIMLTGDNQITANIIAKQLGLDCVIADVLPVQKANLIKELRGQNKIVMMCGDGINDSPALASADVGVSVSNGTDIAMNSADVILMSDQLSRILDLLFVSKKTIRNIKQNLFWAFFYNCLMIPIALGAFRFIDFTINPMIAGIAMVASSLTVVLNALRLNFVKKY